MPCPKNVYVFRPQGCAEIDLVARPSPCIRRESRATCSRPGASTSWRHQERLENITVLVSKDGTRAAAEFNVHGKYLNSESGLPTAKGQTYVLPAGTFFAIHDGKIARVTTYYNLTDWIAQARIFPVPKVGLS